MTIETKYNIGDEVWYAIKGKVYHEIVLNIIKELESKL